MEESRGVNTLNTIRFMNTEQCSRTISKSKSWILCNCNRICLILFYIRMMIWTCKYVTKTIKENHLSNNCGHLWKTQLVWQEFTASSNLSAPRLWQQIQTENNRLLFFKNWPPTYSSRTLQRNKHSYVSIDLTVKYGAFFSAYENNKFINKIFLVSQPKLILQWDNKPFSLTE